MTLISLMLMQIGRDSIRVMFSLCLLKIASALCSAPTLCAMLTMRLDRSRPVGPLHCRPNTKNRVALLELSWISWSRIFTP